MKIKLLLLLLLLRVRSKKTTRGGGQRAHLFVGIWVQHWVSQLNATRTAVFVTSCHVSWDSRGIFCPPSPPPPKWFLRVFMSEAKKSTQAGGGEEHNFLSEIWVQQGVSQLSATRIAGRWGTPLMWGTPHVHLISPTITPPIK